MLSKLVPRVSRSVGRLSCGSLAASFKPRAFHSRAGVGSSGLKSAARSWKALTAAGVAAACFSAAAVVLAESDKDKKEQKGQSITTAVSESGPARYDLLPKLSEEELNKLSIFQQMEYFVQKLQNEICQAVDSVEGQPSFHEDRYIRPSGGVGITRVINDKGVIEKGAVNVSVVQKVPMGLSTVIHLAEEHPDLRKYIPNPNGFPKEFPELRQSVASISLILHPRNPFAPTVHLNVRYFEILEKDEKGEFTKVGSWWFGGGTDLTPHYLFDEDAKHFHQVLKDACDPHDKSLYPAHKKWCDEYFYIKHRKEERGIGGVFYDDMRDREPKKVLEYTKSVGSAFVPAFIPVLKRRKDSLYEDKHRKWQEIRHGRYVEFNLMYDKGTKYGLNNPSARVESILVSLPLTVRYEYNYNPDPESAEGKMQSVLVKPRDWLGVDTGAKSA